MKKTKIELLVADFVTLANRYAKLATDCRFKLSHHTELGKKPNSWDTDPTFREDGKSVIMYVGSDYESWSLKFEGPVEITSWHKAILLPWNMTPGMLKEIYDDALTLINTIESAPLGHIKQWHEDRIKKELAELDAKRKQLVESLNTEGHENVEQSN